MIEKNIGNIERLVRIALALCLAAWAYRQRELNGIDWFVVAVAVALFLNGVFSRCYLWYVLDINTCGTGKDCRTEYTCP
jgi:hypothetical protein